MLDESVLPRCPRCGALLSLNARGDDTFLHTPHLQHQLRLIDWVQQCIDQHKRLVVLEFGVGLRSTPVVVRFPVESMVRQCGKEHGHLVRVNLTESAIPPDLAGVPSPRGMCDFVAALSRACATATADDMAAAEREVAQQRSHLKPGDGQCLCLCSCGNHLEHFDWRNLLEMLR
eukprot:TRINITY_DN5013_c0_g1_i1.p1 TRINITY_DN5013_c0_g1~~TRINITY_DN5013_c0_g1_i1.p1  ORF type:complete len:174 (+),score=43.05 TRINITY_DN5013_c0_g1_i1:693-1214(+)